MCWVLFRAVNTGAAGGFAPAQKDMDYKGKRWQRKRLKILKRDGYMCQYSKRFGRRVDATMVHHIYPVSEYPEYAWCDWNLISLSNAAHEMMHDKTNGRLTAEGERLKKKTIPPRGSAVSNSDPKTDSRKHFQ